MTNFLTVLLLSISFLGLTQNEIKNFKWAFGECNNDLDPYKIRETVSSYDIINDTTYISIGFGENCCVDFDTLSIISKSKNLHIYPKESDSSMTCGCVCCFSIDLIIPGNQKINKFYIFNKEAPISNEPYKTYPITYKIKNNDTINKKNIYGDKVGYWNITNQHYLYDSAWNFYTDEGHLNKSYRQHDSLELTEYRDYSKEQYIIYKGDTINRIDSLHRMQGTHIDIDVSGLQNNKPIRYYIQYKDNTEQYGTHSFHSANGELFKETLFMGGKCISIKHYEKGKLQKTCTCNISTHPGYAEELNCIENHK